MGDSEKAKQMSPMFNLDLLKQSPKLKTIRHLVVVGENDSAEFKRQSKTYSQALDSRHGRRYGGNPFGGSFRHRREAARRRLLAHSKDRPIVEVLNRRFFSKCRLALIHAIYFT